MENNWPDSFNMEHNNSNLQNNQLESKKLLSSIEFCVFDLETTGGNHKHDKVIEIGLIKIKSLKIVEKKHYLINPEIKIPDFIQKLTSIAQEDVVSCPKIGEVIEDILDFMGDSVLVAHNTSFDIPFFNSVLKRLNIPERTNQSICTNLMTKYLIPNLLNSNLNYMSKIFDIKHAKAHRALDDAFATAELLIHFLNIFIKKGIKKINHLYYPRNKFELDRIHLRNQNNKEKIKRDLSLIKTPFLITIKGKNGVILFSLPCLNLASEHHYILDKLESLEWEIITIKLFGTLLEPLIIFANIFGKFNKELKLEIVEFLKISHITENGNNQEADKINFSGQFVIARHLIPEQFIVYPLHSLHKKTGLIFRYPGHKKKLIQYVKSKHSKYKKNKYKKSSIDPYLKDFLFNFLSYSENQVKDFIVLEGCSFQKQNPEFLNRLDHFSLDTVPPFNFPLEYIY
ncbi:3'-5' exonuclease [Bacteriovoracales bacterium]|nr:3'-5' exonuclease [Bacteriovoracales bacterium]